MRRRGSGYETTVAMRVRERVRVRMGRGRGKIERARIGAGASRMRAAVAGELVIKCPVEPLEGGERTTVLRADWQWRVRLCAHGHIADTSRGGDGGGGGDNGCCWSGCRATVEWWAPAQRSLVPSERCGTM